MKQLLIILLLCSVQLSCSHFGRYNNSARGRTRCEEFKATIDTMSGCEKLAIYSSHKKYKMSSRCADALASNLESITGIKSKADRGIAGYIYMSKKDIQDDIRKWSEALGCTKDSIRVQE